MTERVIVKRVSLEGIYDLDDECFALIKPATVQDKIDFRQAVESVKSKDGSLEADFQQKMVDSHFVSGKIKALSESGEYELVDMTKDDIELAEISDRLFMKMQGIDLDPKDIAAAAAENSTQSDDEKPTEMPSSTDSTS